MPSPPPTPKPFQKPQPWCLSRRDGPRDAQAGPSGPQQNRHCAKGSPGLLPLGFRGVRARYSRTGTVLQPRTLVCTCGCHTRKGSNWVLYATHPSYTPLKGTTVVVMPTEHLETPYLQTTSRASAPRAMPAQAMTGITASPQIRKGEAELSSLPEVPQLTTAQLVSAPHSGDTNATLFPLFLPPPR